MNLQVINSENGKPMGVFIPIKEWEFIKAEYHISENGIKEKAIKKPKKSKKNKTLEGFRQAVKELQLVLDGKLEARPLKDVLNEL
ncbi:MAG: hypothetical protein EAZ53_00025 [Bacteroidetes bacterium]|nr:MAG: hypothetical protein EAZ53_00025 [Bacteroidota bacterium]